MITVPCVTGKAERQAFTGHPGWVDVYEGGESTGRGARIGPDGQFELRKPEWMTST